MLANKLVKVLAFFRTEIYWRYKEKVINEITEIVSDRKREIGCKIKVHIECEKNMKEVFY